MRAAEARVVAERHARGIAAALDPPATLEQAPTADSVCDDLQPAGRVTVAVDYWLRHAGSNSSLVDQLHAHWASRNFDVLTDQRDGELLYLRVQHRDDGFRLIVAENVRGDLSLTVASPCVWP